MNEPVMNEPAISAPVLSLRGLERYFQQGGRRLDVLCGVDLDIRAGEMVALIGASGTGKSTLLHTAGLLERPEAGQVIIDGQDASTARDAERTRLRRDHIGFVYQYHHLLPEFTAKENVMLPQRIAGIDPRTAAVRAEQLLCDLGLEERLDHVPSKLSGGEQQRVAIARAIANKPVLLLADEPTGNLDQATATRVFDALLRRSREEGLAALVATHNPDLAARMDRVLRLDQGRIVDG